MASRVLLIVTYAGCPRTWKMAKVLAESKYHVHILEWDRESHLQKQEQVGKVTVHRFSIKAPYGNKLFYLLPIWWFYTAFFCLINRFDIIVPQNLDNLIPILILKPYKRFKIVYDLADFYSDAYVPISSVLLRSFIRYIELFLLRVVDATIIVDEDRIRQIGFIPKNLYIIYNSPPDFLKKYLHDANTFSSGNNMYNFKIFYGGCISEDRGLHELVKACQKISGVTLIIAGFGPAEKYFVNFIKRKKNVLFLGRIPYEDVLKWSIICDCIVILYDPIKPNNVYASPNKLFEAMMCGKPVIVSSETTMAKKVQKHMCGLVIDYGNIHQLEKAIMKLKNNPELAMYLGKNGRTAYLKKYNWQLMERRLLELFTSLFLKNGEC